MYEWIGPAVCHNSVVIQYPFMLLNGAELPTILLLDQFYWPSQIAGDYNIM